MMTTEVQATFAKDYTDGYDAAQVDLGARTEAEHREADINAAKCIRGGTAPGWKAGYEDAFAGRARRYEEF